MFNKILVANRGEIAVRAFRAARELGCRTVAVFAQEDRNSEHRVKADESYQIGESGHPVAAYLDIDGIIAVAKHCGAEAIYPGYGFLSENPDFAAACADAGLVFVGPSARTIRLAGNKVRAIEHARAAGLPTLQSTSPTTDIAQLARDATQLSFPMFVKAVAGGGGRGMRRVDRPEDLAGLAGDAMRESESAFGDGTVYLEQAVLRPRHIEVQVLADQQGNQLHLFERDCSIQRRHQKVIEMAPAPQLDAELRASLTAAALAFTKEISYTGAGTVEFLLETAGPQAGNYVFIEMNPRIQVEHTVTEEITDVDIVASQLRIAAGESLAEIGLRQDDIKPRGAAIQCRITTEDPENSFRPDTGVITAYSSASGAGIRLDGGTVGTGVAISPHFDSMLVKLTARGRDHATAIMRARRALSEFQIEGVATNIAFLEAVLAEPDLLDTGLSTAFISERPYLLHAQPATDRNTKLLRHVAHVTVNHPYGLAPARAEPRLKLPDTSDLAPIDGSRQALRELGPVEFNRRLRAQRPVAITETTFRDAHQSLLATRLRSIDLLNAAKTTAKLTPGLLSVECWGGATYDVALRFLAEDPWERLAALRTAMPNQCLQMLLRGRNTVGYTPYPTAVAQAFVAEATEVGIDVFRIFDALNDVEQLRPAIDAVLGDGRAIAQAALCYSGDLLDPAEDLYTLDYYLRLAEQLVEAGAHSLAIKDMAGLLRPYAAKKLVTALRKNFDLPVQVHTHDTAGGQIGTLLAAIEAGADAVDVASAPMSATTSQPSMSALVMGLAHTERAPELDPDAVLALEPYWEATRKLYRPFESGLPGPTGRVYTHEIPGGQLSNLRQQASALGLGDQFEQIEEMYAAANQILGRPTKVTPSSKVVGDLALHLVAVHADPEQFAAHPEKFDLPDSVLGFLSGELGTPAGGWPEPFRTKALAGRVKDVTINELTDDDAALLAEPGRIRQQTLNRLLFPGPTADCQRFLDNYGDLSALPTMCWLYGLQAGVEQGFDVGNGRQLTMTLEAISEPDKRAERTVLCQMDGQLRAVKVRDESIQAEVARAERADPNNPGHVAAPFAGAATPRVTPGDRVEAGQVVAGIEAMKMESTIAAPCAGLVARVVLNGPTAVEGGDLICVIDPAQ